MREIKFKAFYRGRMYEVVSIICIQGEAAHLELYDGEIHEVIGSTSLSPEGDIIWLKNCKLIQFTGLKDSKGKEIYEGDIVTWGYGNVPVSMGTIPMGDCIPPGMCTGWVAGDSFVDPSCEVIGNVHLNPELLGGS